MVAKYVGHLCLSLAALTAVPALVALLAGDLSFAWRGGLMVALLAGGGWLGSRIPQEGNLQQNEALVMVVAAFLIAPLAMTFPLMSAGLCATDAFFESVSGITTTGLSVVPSVSAMSPSFLFARAWMTWYGGLGIVILSLALVTRPGMQARRILAAGGSKAELTDIVGSTRAHARRMGMVYLSLTGAALLVLLLTGAGLFSAVVHTLSSVSTGGFSTTSRSLAGLPSPATRWAALALGMAGAVPFAIYYRTVRGGRWRRSILDPEVIAFAVAAGAVAVLLTFSLRLSSNITWLQALSGSFSTALSAQSTTGFSTLSVADLPAVAKSILIVSMATGGCLGSTAGGLKWVRILLLFKAVAVLIARSSLPRHAVLEPRLRDHRIEPNEINDAALILVLFLVTIVTTWLVFLAAGLPPLDSLFDVVSATATVGLSTGVVDATLTSGLKLLLCANMLLGRLEIVALLVFLYPYTWFGKRRSSQ